MKKLLVFFAFYLISLNIQAQTTSNPIPESSVKTNSVSIMAIPDSTNSGNINSTNSTTANESISTPEQQGFTKYITNDKVIYYKEQGLLKIEYKPNN